MAIHQTGSLVHWNYYIALEQDLSKISRYIEFSEENYNVYSIELAHLLLACSSEVDVVLKALCNSIKPANTHENILHYRQTVKEMLPEMTGEKCYIPRYGIELCPWDNWNGEENPLWWRGYNKVKHQRDAHFQKANLKNTINSLAGLSVAILYYYREVFADGGARQEFRDVTSRLQPEASFVEFKKEYYYHNYMVSM